jgi:hypothetical protein
MLVPFFDQKQIVSQLKINLLQVLDLFLNPKLPRAPFSSLSRTLRGVFREFRVNHPAYWKNFLNLLWCFEDKVPKPPCVQAIEVSKLPKKTKFGNGWIRADDHPKFEPNAFPVTPPAHSLGWKGSKNCHGLFKQNEFQFFGNLLKD